VGLALQLAIAEATGLGFVLLDGADLLDADNRATLVELLELFEGQAIVTATKDAPPAAIPEGVAVYWLALVDGVTTARRLEAAEEVPA
jgi:hypothetical protein